jgi:two-component system invasion response regulator UvrY
MTPTDPPVQVLVVDDQPAFRAAARAVVEHVPGFVFIGEAASGEEAIALAERLAPDLVLMDINMGDVDGIEATQQIIGMRPDTKVVLLSTYESDQLPRRARTSGAVAYVNKDELSQRSLRRLWEAGGDPRWTGAD